MANDSRLASPPFVVWLDEVGVEGFADLADELWSQIPALHSSPTGAQDMLRSSVVSHFAVLRASFFGEPHPAVTLPSAARQFVEYMALADASLSGILRSYEIGHASIWRGYTSFLRESSLPHALRADELEAGSIRMFEYMQTMTSETVVTFNQVRNSVMQERNSRRGEIVKDVLAGSADATNLLESLGYRADDTHIGYVAWSVADSGAGEEG